MRNLDRKYDNYIHSITWEVVRQMRFDLDGNKCVICGRPMDLQCHHLTYDRFRHEDIHYDLITLCKNCHEEIEERKHERGWRVTEQLSYIFIRKYYKKDSIFGGKENLCNLDTIKKYFAEMLKELHMPGQHFRTTDVQHFFRDKRIEFIKAEKAIGAPVDYLRAKGISEHMINKYYYSKEDK